MPYGTFNYYPWLRPFLFALDPEYVHHLSVRILKTGLLNAIPKQDDPILNTNICGLAISNPIGLAAGFDKQAEIMGPLLNMGFGAIEVGSITPLPQPGNPKPRLFRIPEAEAIINRFGFNSDGFQICRRRLETYLAKPRTGIMGVNIGKNKESENAHADYVEGVRQFAPLADYLTINLSSPNTPGLRDLQRREPMKELLSQVIRMRDKAIKKPPLFVKIAPDQSEADIEDIAEVVETSKVDGIIMGNTTVTRPSSVPVSLAKEAGGLSGKPLRDLSTTILARLYQRTQGKIPLIGCGGVFSGADAYAKIRAGASLVQLYTALIYEGPTVVERIKKDLATLLRRDGFQSLNEAVGKD